MQNATLSGVSVARSKNALAGGSARQRTTVCTFVVFVQYLGALPVRKINRNKGTGRAYGKNFFGKTCGAGGRMAEIAS